MGGPSALHDRFGRDWRRVIRWKWSFVAKDLPIEPMGSSTVTGYFSKVLSVAISVTILNQMTL